MELEHNRKQGIYLRFHMDPVAKQRPRFGKGRTYTPKETRKAEAIIKGIASRSLRGFKPYDEPIQVDWRFVLPRPKKPKFSYPACKPDLDNLVKLVSDALNGIAWVDDSRIVQQSELKMYGSGSTPIGIHVIVKPFEMFD